MPETTSIHEDVHTYFIHSGYKTLNINIVCNFVD